MPIHDWSRVDEGVFHVSVPLEKTYQEAWASCPADMRALVEHGTLPGEAV